jgi:hypothetical protein
MTPEFETFNKIARLSRLCTITEKIDGTNAQILITEDGQLFAGSRSRWLLTPEGLGEDNFGFGRWVQEHKDELIPGLGIGRHYGEWWGAGIQRRYGMKEKVFSLFNTKTWSDPAVRPACCNVVPVLFEGIFNSAYVDCAITLLKERGSIASPGFMDPEGIVIWHDAARIFFKKTLKGDEKPKGSTE